MMTTMCLFLHTAALSEDCDGDDDSCAATVFHPDFRQVQAVGRDRWQGERNLQPSSGRSGSETHEDDSELGVSEIAGYL